MRNQMKTIGYYISNTGFGHLTRSLAIIESILRQTDYHIYFVCGQEQTDYAKVYLIHYQERCHYNNVSTEAVMVHKPGRLQIDTEATEQNVKDYLDDLEQQVSREVEKASQLSLDLVVTDISILGIMVGKQLGVPTVGISNYTWYHRFKKLGFDKSILAVYKKAYNQLDKLYQLALHDAMPGLTCPTEEVGFVMRPVSFQTRVDLEKRYWPACYLSIGMVASKEELNISFQAGHVFVTGEAETTGDAHVVRLPKRISHSQDYVAASSLALVKPGWSTVAECLILKIPFGIIDVEGVEDAELFSKLQELKCCFTYHEDALDYIDVKRLNRKAAKYKQLDVENSTDEVALTLINHLKEA